MKGLILIVVLVVLCAGIFLAKQALDQAPTFQPSMSAPPGVQVTPWPTSRPLPTLAPTTAAGSSVPDLDTIQGAGCVPEDDDWQLAEVVSVVDGDTINVAIDGRRYAVRYIGIDAPEWTRQHEPYGDQATERNRALLEDQAVWLIKDVSETDRYDRLLRYVFAGGVFVNDALVREGLAEAGSYPPDTACRSSFYDVEDEAREAGRGMWGDE